MSEPYIGEIILFAGNFAPRGWQFCQGQILSIAQNTALFSILGTTYGGNGQTTFALPDLRGRVPVSAGQGPGLSNIALGEVGGTPSTTILVNNLPPHNHTAVFSPGGSTPLTASVAVANTPADQSNPDGALLAQSQVPSRSDPTVVNTYATAGTTTTGTLSGVSMSGTGQVTVGVTGNGTPISTQSPYLGLNYIIAVQGIFPSRN
jgi:microcystin-dependent protein